jgi:predicted outer membrane repeat protein
MACAARGSGRPFLLASLAALLWSLAARLVALSACGAYAQTVLDSLQDGTATSVQLLSNSTLTLPASWSTVRLGSASDVFAKSYSVYANLESQSSPGQLPAVIVCPPAAAGAPLEDTELGRRFVFWLEGMASLSINYVRFRNCRNVVSLRKSAALQLNMAFFEGSWLAVRLKETSTLAAYQTTFEKTRYVYDGTRETGPTPRDKVRIFYLAGIPPTCIRKSQVMRLTIHHLSPSQNCAAGVICVLDWAQATLSNVNFTNINASITVNPSNPSSATDQGLNAVLVGTGIFIFGGGTVRAEYTNFVSVKNPSIAGAVYMLGPCFFECRRCGFGLCSSALGGAMYLDQGATASISMGTFFTQNTATFGGGAIYNDGNLYLDQTTIRKNTARYYGAGIFQNSPASTLLARAVNMYDNNAIRDWGCGGCLCAFQSANVTILNSNFTNNFSGGVGGCLSFGSLASHVDYVRIQDCNFTENTVYKNDATRQIAGGAIFFNNPPVESRMENLLLLRNKGGNGAAVYLYIVSDGSAPYASFNRWSNLTVQGSDAYYAAVSLVSNENWDACASCRVELILENSRFSDNAALSSPDMQIQQIGSNSAFSVTIRNTVFLPFASQQAYAGSVYILALDIESVFDNCEWSGSTSRFAGAVMTFQGGRTIISNSRVRNCTGFGIMSTGLSNQIPNVITIVNTTFEGNAAQQDFFNLGPRDTLELRNVTVTDFRANSLIRTSSSGLLVMSGCRIGQDLWRGSTIAAGVVVLEVNTTAVITSTTFSLLTTRAPVVLQGSDATLDISSTTFSHIVGDCAVGVCIPRGKSLTARSLSFSSSSCSGTEVKCAGVVASFLTGPLRIDGVTAAGIPGLIYLDASLRGNTSIAGIRASNMTRALVYISSLAGRPPIVYTLSNITLESSVPADPGAVLSVVASGRVAFPGCAIRVSDVRARNVHSRAEMAGLFSFVYTDADVKPSNASGVVADAMGTYMAAARSLDDCSASMVRVNAANCSVRRGGVLLSARGPVKLQLRESSVAGMVATQADSKGGTAILAEGAQMHVENSTFERSEAAEGGLFRVEGGSRLLLQGTVARACVARGFLISLSSGVSDEMETLRSLSPRTGCGTAMEAMARFRTAHEDGISVQVNELDFGNSAVVSTGGPGCVVVANASTFQSNVAVNRGGVAWLSPNSTFLGRGNRYLDNWARQGAVFFAASLGSVRLDDPALAGNASSGAGNCALFDTFVSTYPARLSHSFGEGAYPRGISGSALASFSVYLRDELGARYEFPEIFSVQVRAPPQNSTESGINGAPAISLDGFTSAFGVFGEANFTGGGVRVVGSPGARELSVERDVQVLSTSSVPSLHRSDGAGNLTAALMVGIERCPPGRYVDRATRVCLACANGTFSSGYDSDGCKTPDPGLYTLDGATLLSCSAQYHLQYCFGIQDPRPVLAAGVSAGVVVVAAAAAAATTWILHRRRVRHAEDIASKSWLIDASKIVWISVLGKGAQGECWLCMYKETLVCVKRVNPELLKCIAAHPPSSSHDDDDGGESGTPLTTGGSSQAHSSLKGTALDDWYSSAIRTVPHATRTAYDGKTRGSAGPGRTTIATAVSVELEDEIRVHAVSWSEKKNKNYLVSFR